MAKPSTREELKQYCLRTLGKPVIEINVEDDQLEDRMDEGLQFFQEYHFDGVERMYNIHRITGSTVKIASNTGAFTVGEKITGGTSNATAKVVSSNTTVITFKSHKDTDDIANNDTTSSFSNGETITGSTSGSTAVAETDASLVTFGDVDNHYITLSDSIIGVTGIFDIQDTGGAQTSSDLFSFRYQFHLNEMPYLTATSIINYKMSMQHLQLLNDMFVGKKPLRFNRHQNRLYLDIDWDNDDLEVDEYVVAECYRIIEPATFTDVYNDMFLKKYVTALFKRQWGANLIKYEGVQLPGGTTLNGRTMFEEAITELRETEEQVSLKYELPVDFMVGPG
jgi:hypothetical protein